MAKPYEKMRLWSSTTLKTLVKRGSGKKNIIPKEMRQMAWGILVERGERG